jgi:malonyl-CoA/methylmalonyl-CoA synthetase
MVNNNLYTHFAKNFLKYPKRDFLSSDHGSVKFENIHEETGFYVAMFSNIGISKGDRVVVQVDKSIEAVLLYLACLRYGAIYIPLNTAYTKEELRYFLSDSMPELFVCDPRNENSMRELANELKLNNVLSMNSRKEGTLFHKLSEVQSSSFVEVCNNDDLAAILYTSGTTGRSKGAMLTHNNLLSNALVLLDYWAWEENDILLHALPIFHVHGLFVALNCALLNVSKVIFLDFFDSKRVISELPNSTVMMGVPTFYVRLLNQQSFNKSVCQNMRLFISGSAPLLSETFNSFEERTGMRILERYGMSETSMITSNPYSGNRVAGTVGFFLPTVSGRIVNENGEEAANGEIGILEMKGPNVFKGYWKMPEKTKLEFTHDGYFITGDMASMDCEGRITIVGREKDLIISGGYNVYPKEVEIVLDMIRFVKESCVIGLPHSDFGEAVTALIILKETTLDFEENIKLILNDKLAKFKHPKKILLLEEIPRNTMGKVQKNILRDQYKNLYLE